MEARTGFVPVHGARLFLRDVGEGVPIVVLHGGPDFSHDYLVPELDVLATSFRLVHYDQRGRGRSAAGVRPGDVTLESELDDLDRVRRHLGLESMALLGHSWGGVLAMEYALRHPERLTHLVLMDTAPATSDDAHALGAHLQALPGRDVAAMRALAESPAYLAGDLGVEAAYYRLHFSTTVARPELLERLLPRLRAHVTPEGVVLARAIEDRLYDETWAVPGYDLLGPLHRLDVPTLVLHGEHDLVPVELAAHVADAIPGARLVVLPGCGHFTYLEDPDAVAREVSALLSR